MTTRNLYSILNLALNLLVPVGTVAKGSLVCLFAVAEPNFFSLFNYKPDGPQFDFEELILMRSITKRLEKKSKIF